MEDSLRDLHMRVLRARRASGEERKELLHDHSDEVLNALLDNEGLSEEELLIILQRKDLSFQIIQRISKDGRLTESYSLKRALLFNPKTPASISLRMLGQLFTFDIMQLMLIPAIPGEVKTASEEALCRKLQHISLGERLTLARRTNGDRILTMLMEDVIKEVASAALNNPFLREGTVCAAIRRPGIRKHTVDLIAMHPKWSLRHDIRYALLRNKYLSTGAAMNFLKTLTLNDLRELSGDPTVSPQIRSYIKNLLSNPSARKTGRFD
jgi:hypothetical protein